MEPGIFPERINKMTFEEKVELIFSENNNYWYILSEKTFDIRLDVDYIWEKGFVPWFSLYKRNPEQIFKKYNPPNNDVYLNISSKDLPSDIAKEAHKKKPIEIRLGYFKTNSYLPTENKLNLTFNAEAIEILGTSGLLNLRNAKKEYPMIGKVFELPIIKGTVAHELSHWMDDALHNEVLKKEIEKRMKNSYPDDDIQFKAASRHEIDACIHSLIELKRTIKPEIWDKLSFEQLLEKNPILKFIVEKIKTDKNIYNPWIKKFFGRLSREGLLGKNMSK